MSKLKKCSANTYGAPLVIIVCADHNVTWKKRQDNKDFYDIDASIVTTHMMLQATDLGLGSVWIGSFDANMIKKEFNLSESVEAVNILDIGYAADGDKLNNNKKRKPLGVSTCKKKGILYKRG